MKPTRLGFFMPSPTGLEFTFPLLMKMCVMSKWMVLAQLSLLKHLKAGFSSVQLLSHVRLCDPMDCSMPDFPCPSPTPWAYSNSCPSCRWCHPTISSSVVPFSSCPQSFLAWGSFPMSQLFTSGDQSIGVSALAAVLPMNIQDWFPLAFTGWISLQSQGFSRVFSNTTI